MKEVELLNPMLEILDPEIVAQNRARDPVWWDERLQLWVVSRHEDIAACLMQPEVFSSDILAYYGDFSRSAFSRGYEALLDTAGSLLIARDGPEHMRLRRAISPAFLQRVRAAEPKIEQRVHQLIDEMAGKPSVDLVSAFCDPLPLAVICQIVGVPETSRAPLETASKAILQFITFGGTRTLPAFKEIADRARGQLALFESCVEDLLQSRRAFPRQDLLSDLIHEPGAARRLTDREIVTQVLNIFLAGFITVARFMGMALFRLLKSPHLYAELASEPALIPNAVEELLRLDSPSVFLLRVAQADCEVRGKRIEQGQLVLLHLDAGNYDDSFHVCPHAVAFQEKVESHLTFGKGVHFCMGAKLARLEGHIAFKALVERLPDMALIDQEPLYDTNYLEFRGLSCLRVRIT